jgi:hypothetical protein
LLGVVAALLIRIIDEVEVRRLLAHQVGAVLLNEPIKRFA